MKLILTCGPGYEPIDRVRRITNFSTGRLGTFLSDYFAQMGHEVWCLKGELAVAMDPISAVKTKRFATNDDLAEALKRLSATGPYDAVLHAAALCDFRVSQVLREDGTRAEAGKIPTGPGQLHLVLEPAIKILPMLREWFPSAKLVGWKFEVEGTRSDALEKAWKQLSGARTDLCILNGPAWGEGFGLCRPDKSVQEISGSSVLAETIHELLPPSSGRRQT